MSKVKFLFTLVILTFVALLVQAISEFILWLALPHGRGVATVECLVEVRLNEPLSGIGALGWTYTNGQR